MNYSADRLTGQLYCIFRVSEKKYKSIKAVKGFECHMLRIYDTPNARKGIENEILIGSSNITEDVKEYTKDVKLRKNGVLARDLLLTSSPEFFNNLDDSEKQKWVDLNIQFLQNNFGDNCLFAALHKDESTWHIHALIVPKFDKTRGTGKTLANSRYFDGKDKLSKWQDVYAEAITSQFKQLNRGVKYSKARHVKIRQFYTLINKKYNPRDMAQVEAKIKENELLKENIKRLQETLSNYKKYDDIKKEIKEIKEDKEIYKQTIRAMSEIYKIPQEAIINIVSSIEKKNDADRSR